MADPEQTPDRRPRPEYGEYAPEGWEWTPEPTPSSGGVEAGSSQGGVPHAPAAQNGAPSTHTTNAGVGPIPGVPHNLGAGSPLPQKGARPAQTGSGAPYRASQTGAQGAQPRRQANTNAGGGEPAARNRAGDRIATIVLLALGAIGALQLGAACFTMATTFIMLGDTAGIDEFTAPEWLASAGKVLGVTIFTLYALTLIYSIRRFRSGKLTFWVPLTAGVIAVIIVLGLTFAALIGTPELMAVISDPDQAQKLIESMQSFQVAE